MEKNERKYIGDICYIQLNSSGELTSVADRMTIELSAKEYKILYYFIVNKNQGLSLEQIANYVWGSGHAKNPESIKSQITHIRKKLDRIQPGLGNACIVTNRGYNTYTMKIPAHCAIDTSIGVSHGEEDLPKSKITPKHNTANVPMPIGYSLHTNCPRPDLVAETINGYADEILKVCDQLSQHNNKAALVGMGGVGKSELAKAIAASSSELFTTHLWVNFSNSLLETITNDNTFSIWGCSRENFPKDTDRQYFERKMRILKSIADSHVLIIIDGFNVCEDSDLEEFLSGEYAVLITTQYQPTAGNLPTFQITHFKDETKQLALFREKYKRRIEDSEVEDILAMIRSWQGHTLGICVLATTMREKRLTPKEMRTLLCDKKGSTTENSLASIIRSALHKVFSFNNLSVAEQYIMQNLALIPESGISSREFCEWLEMPDYKVIENLIERSLIVHDSYADTIHLHSMITDLILPTSSDITRCTNLVNNLAAVCKKAFDCTYMRKLELLGYVQSVYDKTINMSDAHLTTGMQLGNILEMLGKYEESANVFKQLRGVTNSGSLRVIIDSKIAHGLLLAGNLKEGHRVALEGHKAFQKLPKEQIDKQAQRVDNWLLQRLCEYYRWIGSYDVAEAYGNDSIGLLQNGSREAAWDIGWSKYHLAYALLVQGKLEECKQHLNEAISLFNEISSEYSSAFAMELLGQALMLEGDYFEALDLTVSAGSILQKALDPNHADCGRNWMCQGNIHRRAGREKEALQCYTKAINVFQLSHKVKANIVEALLNNNEIVLDLWGKAFQLDNAIHS